MNQDNLEVGNNIAILVPNFAYYSGDAIVAANQAETLKDIGKSVEIFTLSGDMVLENIKIHKMGLSNNIFLWRIQKLFYPLYFSKLYFWLPKFKEFDVIIAHLYPMTFFASLAKKKYGVEYIFWFHGLEDPRLFKHAYEKIYMIVYILSTKFTLRNVDKIYSVSIFAQNLLYSLFGLQSEVMYNSVNLKKFCKDIDGNEIRRKLNIGNKPVILSVGRIVPQKRVDLLLKSYLLVKKEIPEVKLIIIGKPTFDDYYQELQSLCDDSVIFIDIVPYEQMPKYYSMCDIYATCSYWENHNLPILEAIGCGKDIIAFDIEPFREQIGDNGILVKKGDIQAFARQCINLLKIKGEIK